MVILERYTNLEFITEKVVRPTQINYWDVFNFYKYASGEYNKWAKYSQEIAISHFESCKKEFSKMKWLKGQIRLSHLYPLTLCIGPPWIIKLACQNTKCPKYNLTLCEECTDPNESSTPTLGKLVKTANTLNPLDTIYANSRLQMKIRSIQETIIHNETHLSIIIFDNTPPFVFDGNNRLISASIMEGMENIYIHCYIGIKKNDNHEQGPT